MSVDGATTTASRSLARVHFEVLFTGQILAESSFSLYRQVCAAPPGFPGAFHFFFIPPRVLLNPSSGVQGVAHGLEEDSGTL